MSQTFMDEINDLSDAQAVARLLGIEPSGLEGMNFNAITGELARRLLILEERQSPHTYIGKERAN